MNELKINYENEIKFKKGEILYSENSPANGLLWILSGTIKVYSTDKDSREVILRLATSGDIIGHGFIFGDQVHTDSAKVIEEARCILLKENDFQRLLQENPEAALLLMKKFGKEIIWTQNRCIDLMRKNVRERLACYFHYMSNNYGIADTRGIKIKVQLSREEIASMIGTANETAIRFISEFKAMGLIQEEERYFHILRLEELATIGRIYDKTIT
jgi:CRP-like cAMP-binding protein